MTPVHYFWSGHEFSNVELLTFKSCWNQQHEPWVWTYDTIVNAPAFVKIKDAGFILAQEEFLHFRHNLNLPLANISDIFRYQLLFKVGGIYSDTDIVLVKNLNSIPFDEFFCSTYEYGWGECANGCLMKIQPGSEISKFLLEECALRLRQFEDDPSMENDYCQYGPFVVQECVRKMPITVLPYDYINPISWRWVNELIAFKKRNRMFLLKTSIRRFLPKIEKRGYQLTKNTYAIHLCNEMWKQHGLNKNDMFHSSSLFEQLKAKFTN